MVKPFLFIYLVSEMQFGWSSPLRVSPFLFRIRVSL
jgi:hypothetical protein